MAANGEMYRRLKAIKDAREALNREAPPSSRTPDQTPPRQLGKPVPDSLTQDQARQAQSPGQPPPHQHRSQPWSRQAQPERHPSQSPRLQGDSGGSQAGFQAVEPPLPGVAGVPGQEEHGADWQECLTGVWKRVEVLDLSSLVLAPGIRALLASPEIEPLLQDFGRRFHFDTETTGLSGGAGTRVFLLGWTRLLPPPPGARTSWSLEIRQYFLADFPWEPDFIALVARDLQESGPLDARDPGVLVTYNGASFDIPLVRTRWLMNGLAWPEPAHHDCLHPARRLWKSLAASCSLGSLESMVLGVERHGDPGGAMVPELYFSWLKNSGSQDFRPALAGVFEHHRQDLASLFGLDLAMAFLFRQSRCQGPGFFQWTGPRTGMCRLQTPGGRELGGKSGKSGGPPVWDLVFDPAGLMGYLLIEGDGDGARELARAAWNRFRDPWWGKRLASLVSREEACLIHREIWENTRDPVCLRACLVHLEHRAGDVEGALALLELAESIWSRLPPRTAGEQFASESGHRRQRLLRKLGRGTPDRGREP